MNKYEEIMDYINADFSMSEGLYNVVDFFVKRIYDVSPEKLDIIALTDITLPFPDEMIFEWILNGCYITVRITETESRIDCKLPNGERFVKVHPIIMKIINGTVECLDKIIGNTNG